MALPQTALPAFAALAETEYHKASSEAELLLHCLNVSSSETQNTRIFKLLKEEIDWERLLKMSQRHGVLPLLYRKLDATCPEAVPAEFLFRLREHFLMNATRNHLLTEELCRVLRLMEQEGIPSIPYKGPLLASAVYGDLSLRQFSDLDVMVHPQDMPRVSKILCAEGYRQQWQLTPAQESAYLKSDCERLFTLDQGPTFLDVHWAFVRNHFNFKPELKHFWDRARPVKLEHLTTGTFSPEDLLIILSLHASKDLWTKLIWVRDIAELLRSNGTLNWDQVLTEACKTGTRRMLFLALFLAHRLLQAEIPGEIWKRVVSDGEIDKLASNIIESMFREPGHSPDAITECRLYWRLHERLTDKLRFLFRYAVTSNPADWEVIRLPDSLFPLYHLLRPLRLILKRL